MKNSGFTFLEILVASGLLLAALAWFSPVRSALELAMCLAREELAADFLAQAKLEEILSQPYAEIISCNSEAAGEGDFWREAMDHSVLSQARGRVEVVENPSGLKTITVRLSWSSLKSGRERQRLLISQKCQ